MDSTSVCMHADFFFRPSARFLSLSLSSSSSFFFFFFFLWGVVSTCIYFFWVHGVKRLSVFSF